MKIYTASEVGRRIGKTRNTVVRWVEENRMRAFAFSGDVPYFVEDEIRRIEAQLRKRSIPDILHDNEEEEPVPA